MKLKNVFLPSYRNKDERMETKKDLLKKLDELQKQLNELKKALQRKSGKKQE